MGGVIIGSGTLFLAVGIACLVMHSLYPAACGANGSPPLPTWIFGTGIAYTIIGASFGIVGILMICSIVLVVPWLIIVGFSGFFTFAWMIVGAVSLWRDGGDCVQLNFPIWQMGMAAVIISIVMVVCSGFSARSASENQ